ncbi:hypothetical protein LINGRAHAP2_LOCUS27164 [Linum grandiflorum]
MEMFTLGQEDEMVERETDALRMSEEEHTTMFEGIQGHPKNLAPAGLQDRDSELVDLVDGRGIKPGGGWQVTSDADWQVNGGGDQQVTRDVVFAPGSESTSAGHRIRAWCTSSTICTAMVGVLVRPSARRWWCTSSAVCTAAVGVLVRPPKRWWWVY